MKMSSHSESFSISESLSASALGGDNDRLNTPSVWRTNRTQAASKVDGMASAGMDDIEIPAFLRKQADSIDERVQSSTTAPDAVGYASSSNNSLLSHLSSKIKDFISTATPPQKILLTNEEWKESDFNHESLAMGIASALNEASIHTTSFRIALQHALKLNILNNYAQVIIDLTKLTKDSATSWALLISWLLEQDNLKPILNRHAERLLRNQLKKANAQIIAIAKNSFEEIFLEDFKK